MPLAASHQSHCPPDPRRLILASASPRRIDLLRSLGLAFEVQPSTVAERIDPDLSIAEAVVSIATDKALDVATRNPNTLIVAADTLVSLDATAFGKPKDAAEAAEMLGRLSGRSHLVYTGLVVLDTTTMEHRTRVVETEVCFRHIDRAEIDAYVRTEEPLDKAGAYGMQGLGAIFVERIVGDYWNVVGLPLAALNELLTATGSCLICRSLDARSGEPSLI